LISDEKSDFERKAMKIPIRTQDAIRITIPLKSKYNIPRLDIIIMPIALYNLSTRIIGAVIFLGILKFSFNNSHFNNSPTFPGVILKGKPLRKIWKFFL
jgi:hypothetical protein